MTTTEHMVPLRDGVRLQTFVTLPDGAGPFPTLLAICTYGHVGMEEAVARFVAAGYAVVLQNVRGRLGSEGELGLVRDLGDDGYDAIDWIVAQDWCDGRVGTFGGSALARNQVDVAFRAHPAHLAMAPQVLPFGLNSHYGGAYLYSQIAQWLYLAASGPELAHPGEVDWMPHLFTLPAADCIAGLGGGAGRVVHDTIARRPQDMLSGLVPEKAFAALTTPNLMVTGWYDHCGSGPIDFYLRTMSSGTPEQRAATHLVIGPWSHASAPLPRDEYAFGDATVRDHVAGDIAFFDRHVRGDAATPALPPVSIFVMGRNEWREEEGWPLRRAVPTPFYLHSAGDVRGAWVRGSLSPDAPTEAEPPDSFDYDPADPVPTVGGANSGPAVSLPMGLGPRDQRLTLYRPDVLTYFSDPLADPLEVTGHLGMILYAASSARDTDFTVKVLDVAPDGDARLITDGIVRARFRRGLDAPEPLTPGEVERYEIELWMTSNEFQTGHRIAIAISSSNFPRFNRNLNTFGDNELDTEFVIAHQSICHDSARPSHLLLPVVPATSS